MAEGGIEESSESVANPPGATTCWMAPRDVQPGSVYADAIVRAINQAMVLDALGRGAEANRILAAAEPNFGSGAAYQIALVYAGRKDWDRTFYWLERAYKQHDDGLADLKVDPGFSAVKKDPRYKALLRKMNLPE